jgi:nucleoside-diphosphate-sugar epimerase
MRILIFGGSGMLGHRLWINLSKKHEVWVTVREMDQSFQTCRYFHANIFGYGGCP